MDKDNKSKLIIRYCFIFSFLLIIISIGYLYLFFSDNVLKSVFFDENDYPISVQKDSTLDMDNFNEVISKIEKKQTRKQHDINNFFK